LYIGYRYYDTAELPVRFPFGYGLSYTKFAYSNLKVSPSSVTFEIKNTGKRPGAEIAQIYIGAPQGVTFHPVRELKGFVKVRLEPGESREVTVPLDDKAFRYFNVETNRWEQERGTYRIQVGASSRDIRLEEDLSLEGTGAPDPYEGKELPSYRSGKVSRVGDREFEMLLGRPIPPAKWDREAPLELNDAFAQLSYAKSPIGRMIHRVFKSQVERGNKSGCPDLDALFRYNMPFRGVAKMMGGAVDMAMAEALVDLFNGHFCRGVGNLIGSWNRKRKNEKETRKALKGGK
jgi:beta-glucosidase